MKKLTTAICIGLLGALAFAPAAQAGNGGFQYACNSSDDTNLKDYFCDDGILYEVTVNCMNLDANIVGGLNIYEYSLGSGSGNWYFEVLQGSPAAVDYVCEAWGIYGDSLKTALKCTDAPTGSNKGKPGKGNDYTPDYDQADFEIKSLGPDESCEI